MEGAPRGIQDAISTMVVCDQLCSCLLDRRQQTRNATDEHMYRE